MKFYVQVYNRSTNKMQSGMHKLEFIQYTKNTLRVESRDLTNADVCKSYMLRMQGKIKKKYDRYGQSIYFLCRVDILAIFWYNFRLRTKKIRESLSMLYFKQPVHFFGFRRMNTLE